MFSWTMRIQFLRKGYDFRPAAYYHKTIVEGFVVKGRVQEFWEAESLLRAQFTFWGKWKAGKRWWRYHKDEGMWPSGRPVALWVSNQDTIDRSALDSIFIACGNLLVYCYNRLASLIDLGGTVKTRHRETDLQETAAWHLMVIIPFHKKLISLKFQF